MIIINFINKGLSAYLRVVKNIVKTALMHIFRQKKHLHSVGIKAAAHEQDDIGMPQSAFKIDQ